MEIRPTSIEGAFVVAPKRIEDARGWFARTYCAETFAAAGLNTRWPQLNASQNARRGTLRGLHWQADPHGETKLVRCVRGACVDVAVDLRPDSPSYLRIVQVPLSADTAEAFYIPPGCAHGFQTLADDTELLYMMGTAYVPSAARGLHWADPALAIAWPDPENAIVSDKDDGLPVLGGAVC